MAFFDKVPVVNHSLHRSLQKTGHVFWEEESEIAFGDGTPWKQTLQVTTTAINLARRIIKTTFVVLPKAKEKYTLLGTDFLEDVKIGILMKPRHPRQ